MYDDINQKYDKPNQSTTMQVDDISQKYEDESRETKQR